MVARKTPEAWYWSYDIKPEDLDSVVTPGARLVRLSSYRKGSHPRYAALVHQDAGPDRRYLLDIAASAVEACVIEAAARPVAITVDTGSGAPRFSLVLQPGPGPLSSLHVDLDEPGVRARLDDQHVIADLATYVVDGQRRYAVIVEERPGPSWLFIGVTAHQLDRELVSHGAGLTRVRSYVEGGVLQFAAVAERIDATWAWYADLDPDAVARNLETTASYPFDLDATRDDRGVRFTVVMYRDRLR
jgi:hypothetical protein